MLKSAKERADKFNLDFDITVEDIVIPKYCPVFGFELNTNIARGGPRRDSASLDRIDNSKGYTKDNIRVISNKANQIKSNLTIAQAEKLLEYMKGQR